MQRPAWSEAFQRDRVADVAALPLPHALTREWAWGDGTGAGVRVAVVDSGVDAGHPLVRSVEGAVALEHDADAEGGVGVEVGPHEDLFGHGTACAGVIRSLAPDCEIHSVRVLGRKLTGRGAVLLAGLRWAVDNGMDVVNLSLSTKSRDYFAGLHELADEAYFRGVVLVSAVNNNPVDSYPSLYSSVISVAAREATAGPGFDYNPAPPVEFGAAGIDVDVAWLDGSTVQATGNSFAAPVMAGYVARILSAHPGLTPFQVKTVLHSTADNAVASAPPPAGYGLRP